jgi:hypothetical protein
MDTHPTLTVADHEEDDNVERYLRRRQFAADVIEAARRADAVMRLELALRSGDRSQAA